MLQWLGDLLHLPGCKWPQTFSGNKPLSSPSLCGLAGGLAVPGSRAFKERQCQHLGRAHLNFAAVNLSALIWEKEQLHQGLADMGDTAFQLPSRPAKAPEMFLPFS